MTAASATEMTDQFKGIGLRQAMFLIPVALLITGVSLLAATRTFPADAAANEAKVGRLRGPFPGRFEHVFTVEAPRPMSWRDDMRASRDWAGNARVARKVRHVWTTSLSVGPEGARLTHASARRVEASG
jgi:hypothetical protein